MIILTPAELEALKEGWGEITFDEDGYGSLADGTVICGPANEHECADYDTLAPKMTRYNHDIMASEQPWWPAIKGITVADEECKKQLLAALKYLHNNYTIDTEFMVVNAPVNREWYITSIKTEAGSKGAAVTAPKLFLIFSKVTK